MKGIYEKSTTNIILNGERLNYFSLRDEDDKDGYSPLFYSKSY